MAGVMRRDFGTLPHRDQLEEGAVELDDAVFGAPGVAIAPADLKPEPLVEEAGRVEIANGEDEMVETAGQGFLLRVDDEARTARRESTPAGSAPPQPR
jgi:hypothetical protein